ncbi:MAG: hypothetical protein QME94_18730 [Anaerolineae bacterium]|nr:hypothetical protein [Anaerolineae bacterium]
MSVSRKPSAWFYTFWIDESQRPPMLCQRADDKAIDSRTLHAGERIDDWPAYPTFYVDYHHDDDFVLLWPHWSVFSDRVRLVFEESRIEGVQFLPVRVIDERRQEEVGPYWVLNVVRELDALDWGRTRWHYPDRVQEADPLLNMIWPAFRLDALPGIDIFRLNLRGEHGITPYISRRLRVRLQRAGVTRGMTFHRFPAY